MSSQPAAERGAAASSAAGLIIITPSSGCTGGRGRGCVADDARAGELCDSRSVDVDPKTDERLSATQDRLTERTAIPAEGLDLPEPGKLGDARVCADFVRQGKFGEPDEQRISRDAPLPRPDTGRQAEASDFENVGPLRHVTGHQSREEAVEESRTRGEEQPRRREMLAVRIGHDQIGRIGIVELVEFEAIGECWDVPFEKIDEDALARCNRFDDRQAGEDRSEIIRAPADEAEHGARPEGEDARAAADDPLAGDAPEAQPMFEPLLDPGEFELGKCGRRIAARRRIPGRKRGGGSAHQPTIRRAGWTVPLPGSEVDFLRPISAQASRSVIA